MRVEKPNIVCVIKHNICGSSKVFDLLSCTIIIKLSSGVVSIYKAAKSAVYLFQLKVES